MDTSSNINVSTNGTGEITNPYNAKKNSPSGNLDKDAFLKLLITQLQYQDPLEPMDNTEFVSQMAQFTSLEQMQNLNTTMTASQAFGLIGKGVYATSLDEKTGKYNEYYGVVDSVKMINGEPYLAIGKNLVAYSDVQDVYSDGVSGGLESSMIVSQAMSLIGKNIQAITVDENLNAKGYVEGRVDYVKFVDGKPVLSVAGKEVHTYEVVSVSENKLLIGSEISAVISDGKTIKGKIENINIENDKLYAFVSNEKILIQDINSLISSLAIVGQKIKTDKVEGIVDSVIIKDSKPYLVVGKDEVSYEDIK